MGISVETIVTHQHLAFLRDMRGDSGDKLEWIKSEAEQAGISIEVY
jgi:hypothetical protein